MVHVKVANGNDALLVGSVPLAVVCAEGIVIKIVDDGSVSDDISFGVLAARVFDHVAFCPKSSCRM